jgi:hypothetical protein
MNYEKFSVVTYDFGIKKYPSSFSSWCQVIVLRTTARNVALKPDGFLSNEAGVPLVCRQIGQRVDPGGIYLGSAMGAIDRSCRSRYSQTQVQSSWWNHPVQYLPREKCILHDLIVRCRGDLNKMKWKSLQKPNKSVRFADEEQTCLQCEFIPVRAAHIA